MTSTYTLLTNEADYRRACDTLLGLAQQEILIFDRDLAALRLEEKARSEALSRFLQGGTRRRIRLVLHDPLLLQRDFPRLRQLLAGRTHAMELRQSPDDLHNLADTHLLVDQVNGLRRFHVDQPRSALILDDPGYLQPWMQRFDELWELSQPCFSINTTGL